MAAQTDALSHKFSKLEPLLKQIIAGSDLKGPGRSILRYLPVKSVAEFDSFEERLKSSKDLLAELVS